MSSRITRLPASIAALAALVLAATPATLATPASAHAASSAATPLPSNVERMCPWPPPNGEVSCLGLVRTDVRPRLNGLGIVPEGWGPGDLQDAYDLPSDTAGDGRTVAIVDAYDDPYAESELATYRTAYGLPPCTTANGCFRKVNEDLKTSPLPAEDPEWAGEIALDVQMVSAVCPHCHILLVEATSPNPFALGTAALNAATKGNAKYVSNSYGGPESKEAEAQMRPYYNVPGVAMTVSAGDDGFEAGPEYPADMSGVVAVGGTSLLRADNDRGWAEITWTRTGSGCSEYAAKPPWQKDTGCAKRTIGDVSAVADPQTGVAIYSHYYGGWLVSGGTSASAPIIAATYALAGLPAADGTPPAYALYKHTNQLNDIKTGVNTSSVCTPAYFCRAQAGYDAPTGLGSPNGIGAFVATGGYPNFP
jgi:subtilase family serine protease